MKNPNSSGPPTAAPCGSSLVASAIMPALHRESSAPLGGRHQRSGCGLCGSCTCQENPARADRLPGPKKPPASSPVTWLADRPWIFVLAGFSLLIGAWATFLTLALKNPPRDVLKNPPPTTSNVSPGH